MISAKKLIGILAQVDGDSEVSAYEGEDQGINIYDRKTKKNVWVRARHSEKEDDQTEWDEFEKKLGMK